MTWPRLSESLSFYEPGVCCKCGEPYNADTHITWQECDDLDQPEHRYVELCRDCADKIVERHPRLYIPLEANTPAPGAVGICGDCRHRVKLRCGHPAALSNGGPGLELVSPKPARVHIYRRGGHRKSGWFDVYPGPPVACSGKGAQGLPPDVESEVNRRLGEMTKDG